MNDDDMGAMACGSCGCAGPGGPGCGSRLVVDPTVDMRRDIDEDFVDKASLWDAAEAVPFKYRNLKATHAPPRCEEAVWEHRSTSGLVAAFALAYDHHLPLRLSPDVLWLSILQAVSQWVNTGSNAEKYRHVFVEHADKITLQVAVPAEWERDRSLIEWTGVLSQIRAMAAGYVRGGIVEACAPRFSTTTEVSAMACTISVLDVLKTYFNYSMISKCGLGEVELAGVPADWATLRARTTGLQTALGDVGKLLAPWFAQLDGTLAELASTAAGRAPNRRFWQHAYSKETRRGSGGGTFLSGWFLHFFLAQPTPVQKTHMHQLPSGFVSVPFFWQKVDGSKENFTLCSGTWNAYIDSAGVVFCDPQWVILPGDAQEHWKVFPEELAPNAARAAARADVRADAGGGGGSAVAAVMPRREPHVHKPVLPPHVPMTVQAPFDVLKPAKDVFW
jgi:hypothetical protein